MRELFLRVSESENGMTALDFLKRRGFSQRAVAALKKSGGLTRGGGILRSVDRVFSGETVRAVLEDCGGAEPNPAINAPAVYEDEDVIVFDKPPFLPVHPSVRHRGDTLANLYAALYPDSAFRPINRLDKNTSGLCVCAKNRLSASMLGERVFKTYFAIADGEITAGGVIDLPIARVSDSIIKREVRADGKPSITLYEPVCLKNGRTLLRITLKTGRTHQIRVHFAHMGYPLCGDELYGGDCSAIDRQALHCGAVELLSPISNERVSLKSGIPEDMRRLME